MTKITLIFYLVCMVAFTGNQKTAVITKIPLYAFFLLGSLYMLMKRRIRLNLYTTCIMLYGVLLVVSCFYTSVPEIAKGYLYQYLTCAALTTVIINYLDAPEKISALRNGYFIGAVCLCLHIIVLYGTDVFQSVLESEYHIRIGALAGNPNNVGLSCATGVLCAVYFLLYERSALLLKIVYLGGGTLCLVTAMLTGSKKAFLLLLGGVVGLFVLRGCGRGFLRLMLWMTAAALALGLLLVLVDTLPLFRTIQSRMGELLMLLFRGGGGTSEQERLEFIRTGWTVFLRHPFFGNGMASSYAYFGTYSHNNYIEILMNTGIIGFVLYCTPLLWTVFRLLRIDGRTNAHRNILLVLTVCYLALGFGMVYYYSRFEQILIAAAGAYVPQNEKKSRYLR